MFHVLLATLSPLADHSPPPVAKRRKLGKNPTVDTSFLPDRDREVCGTG